ncbi:unnamed protein product [Caenorhabditis auriculariae]|uniref:Apple domain-containing protein n=1 Tax=Caenorhabditis auriculariae TaxID=2777116 RepID=A0A8S1H194_9PELO|nr:unnamed protein product [Caenorhabditis auriculariae]
MNRSHAVVSFIFFVCFTSQIDCDCSLKAVLRGVNVKQNLGEATRKLLKDEPDCKRKCADLTDFPCKAILWPTEDGKGDCYLLSDVNLKQDIFVDERNFILYVQVCDGEAQSNVSFCQFEETKKGISLSKSEAHESPGATTEASCKEFCVSKYSGVDCNAYIVSTDRASTCTLYATVPQDLTAGSQNLWTKSCSKPAKNCEYTSWSEWSSCIVSCGGGLRQRNRTVLSEPGVSGIACFESETTEVGTCGAQECNAACIFKEWSAYSSCNASCGEVGKISRSRMSLQGSCDPETQTTTCNGALCDSPENGVCLYSLWSEWSSCNSLCFTSRTRTLEVGSERKCEISNGPLNNTVVCEGGQCIGEKNATQEFGTNSNGTNHETATTLGFTSETGCRITNFDPSSRPSSKGFKAVGARENCAAACATETSFFCEAYSSPGPGGSCVLYGKLDKPVISLSHSRYYLQDVFCSLNASSTAVMCHWELARTGVSLDFSKASNFASIAFTIDAAHCGTLCMMNFPIFKPRPCRAYAWDHTISYTTGKVNCFMYDDAFVTNTTQPGVGPVRMDELRSVKGEKQWKQTSDSKGRLLKRERLDVLPSGYCCNR